MTEEIKDCPFCGNKAHYVEAVAVDKLTAPDYVQCLECWAEMEGDGTSNSALIKWNKRTNN